MQTQNSSYGVSVDLAYNRIISDAAISQSIPTPERPCGSNAVLFA